jgi:TolA-binding protein
MAMGDHQPAAVALMRVPILHPDRRHVAAESLLQAGKALLVLGHDDEAARVFHELISSFPRSNAAAEARQRLDERIQKE